jgi:anti-anti-sigma regulatory factor
VNGPGNPRTIESAQYVRCPSLASFLERERGDMIVPVFTPPSRIDATNVAAFARTVSEHVARHGCMVIDCSEVEWITGVGMHVLEKASSDAPITLVNPNPTVHLMAATFGGDVQCRRERATSPASVSEVPTRRLVSVHTDGRVAS